MLKEFDKTLIDVEGHTDSDGADTYNQQLSLQRATSVGSYLQSHGVNGQRIVTLGAGESPSGRVATTRRRQAAESPRGAQAAAHHCAADLGRNRGRRTNAAALFIGRRVFRCGAHAALGFTPETIGTCQTA